MFCTQCGARNPDEARFCHRCGKDVGSGHGVEESDDSREASGGHDEATSVTAAAADVDPSTVGETRAGTGAAHAPYREGSLPGLPDVTLPPWVRRDLGKGWFEAASGALGAAVGLFAFGFALAFLIRVAIGEDWGPISVVLPLFKLAGLIVYTMARIPFRVTGSGNILGTELSGQLDAVLGTLIGVAIVAFALVQAGRYSVRVVGVRDPKRALLQGAKVAVPFAVILAIGAPFFSLSAENLNAGPAGGPAFFWGLVYGVLFGGLGGIREAKVSITAWADSLPKAAGPWVVGTRGALTGISYGLVLSTVVVLAVGAFLLVSNWDMISNELSGSEFEPGPPVWAAVAYAVLVVPSLIAITYLFSHGASLLIAFDLPELPEIAVRINYLNIPTEGATDLTGLATQIAPFHVFLLLSIPLVATVVAGYSVSARSNIATIDQARKAALGVAVPYAVFVWLLAFFERSILNASLRVDFESFDGGLSVGFALLGAFFLTLAWGFLGSLLGIQQHTKASGRELVRVGGPVEHDGPSPSSPATEQNTAHCSACGASNRAGHRFCSVCGETL